MNLEHNSRQDTLAHIERVGQLLALAQTNLAARALHHDQSKLKEPEKSAFDRLKALSLSGMDYGSSEYKACLAAEKPAIQHHYEHNRHHPEHFRWWRCPLCKTGFREEETTESQCYVSRPRFCPKCCPIRSLFEVELEPVNGVDGMSLFDVLEMLLDWKAAAERMKNGGDIRKSLEINTKRFGLSSQLVHILENTIKEIGW